MKEAGEPSTVGVVTVLRGCARHPGVVILAPLEVPRKAQQAKRKPRSKRLSVERGQGQYKGRSPKAPPGVLEELQ
jgi:hypothetical protein